MNLQRLGRKVLDWLPAVVLIAALGLCWQLWALHHATALPTLGAVARELGDRPGLYWANAGVTLEEMAVGLCLSVAVAFVLAVVMTEVRVLERAIMPVAVALNVTPVVSFAPGLVIAFGFGLAPRFIVAAIVVFFPFLINALVGLRSIDRDALDYFRTLDATRAEVLVRLRLPSSLAYLFAAARICVPLSLVGAVVAEFTASGSAGGLGSEIVAASAYSNLPAIYASVFCLALIGLVLSALVIACEGAVLRGRPARARLT
jgi:NitT/TauT family transport system permease protein